MKSLKLSTDRYKHIRFLLGHRGVLLDADMPLANLKKLMAKPYFLDLYELQRAIQRAEKKPVSALIKIKKRARALAGENLTPKPLLDGHELIALGAVPGPQVGELAEELYVEQLSGNLHTPHQAREWVKHWLESTQNRTMSYCFVSFFSGKTPARSPMTLISSEPCGITIFALSLSDFSIASSFLSI